MRVIIGLGCDRNTSVFTVQEAIEKALKSVGLTLCDVVGLATIDKKNDEPAFLLLAQKYSWPLDFFPADLLAQVPVPNPSETVRKYMGTPAVAEAAALLAAGGELILEKYKYQGMDGKNVTVSIARKIMTQGKILLVGFGPGAVEHMTQRARAAIAEADVVIGYSTYIKLVQDLLAGKEVIRKGMTEEIDRCIEAYQQALQGKTVALISSGDIGVYGMAGPTYEVLLQEGWTPDSDIRVEVIPGASALNACAALVGAPLTHDFCSISLSDLLTPWPLIAKRLQAAGQADFVVALYNPKSGRRTGQIVAAQNILLRHRKPETPVAIVKSAYRRRQAIQMTTLEHMADCDIGMLCTVLIGNSSTFVREGLMITPRGYANKYDQLTGETKSGEQAGRSLSMGLTGWHACVREHLREQPELSLRDAAAYFDSTLAEILSAVAASPPEESADAKNYRAVALPLENIANALEAACAWGRLRAIVRSEGGAIAELLLNAEGLQRRGDWLNLVNEYFHLHVDMRAIRHAWFLLCAERQYGLYFCDQHGNAVFSLLLVKQQQSYAAAELTAFEQAVEQFGRAYEPVDPPLETEIENDE